MSLSNELARRALALDPATFDPAALGFAREAIADMIGCALLGAPSATTQAALLSGVQGTGPCHVLGRHERLGRLDAAFVNGVSGHALDFDDTSKSLSGHPTVIIIPAILPIAETLGCSGREVLDAYVIGVEAATRFARGVNFAHYEKGWHPTATLGIFGAAVAASALLKLDEARMANAISMAASLASGIKANFGTDTKPLHAGLAARNGLFAALMAAEGVKAAPVALEHPQGFLEVFNGKGHYDAARMLDGWGDPLDLMNPGISIKKYACVYSVHAAIDAVIALHDGAVPDSAGVEDVVVRMHPRRLLPHVRNAATSALNAKFSLPYAVARGLVNGAVKLEHFEDSALSDPEVTRVMNLIRMEDMHDDFPDYGAEVVVRMADGTELRQSIESPLGRGPEAPLPMAMLEAKFLDCASRSLSAEGAAEVFALLMRLDRLGSIHELTTAISSATRPAQG
ncbi:MmgE/PrpD family protein [Ponticoccus alexandrii]|uniref:MmgE/PrpD family protein n=1 Tax=Ponticoccus alexandrii TaxID=1943633 RepID=A0ABX7FEL2_9RHOB|nr:MmgE/PrpD family protein [Ponticoccus alexandrii]ETA50601.1 2-methylcitrate dehydratase [Rhodobacteraceae bacterium PD-2]QRF68672.1 MmgE/PrpD family protein [Ponticoccus alexandrii]